MQDITKNCELGNDCFIIAPGPSINHQDLTLLNGKTVMAISEMNKHDIYKSIPIKYHMLNRQTYHISRNYHPEYQIVENLKVQNKDIDKDTILIADILDKEFFEKYSLFQDNKIIWRNYVDWNRSKIETIDINNSPSSRLLTESAIYAALFLGFENIFILGADMDYLCNGIESYFNTKKVAGSVKVLGDKKIRQIRGWDAEARLSQLNYTILKFKALYDYKENIFNLNANQNTYVDTFPLIKYEDIVLNENYKELVQKKKEEFVKIPAIYTKREFSSFFSFSYEKILSFKQTNKKYIIYGKGSFGETINKLVPEVVVGFIDKTTEFIDYEYDYIIISVLGREPEILNHLLEKFDIHNDKIITF
ncbi:MAG: hypothetical protein JXQ66_01480 [Campylobacterales bacterium]|nr:hypothetical protein [Campylobacterales bacterium]